MTARRLPAATAARWLPVALLAVFWAATGSALCHARSITIEEFLARIRVENSADVVVEESIAFRFEGSWNGVHRQIPVIEHTRQGFSHRLRLHVESVAGGDGSPLRYESSRQQNSLDLKIFVPGAADAVRTVVIRYRLKNAVRFFDDHDEMYWNVTGDEWPYPILEAKATIGLPGQLDNVRVNAFTGAYGSTGRDASITLDGVAHEADLAAGPAAEAGAIAAADHEVVVRTTRPLGIRQGLTVAVAWNAGVLRKPSAGELLWGWLVDNLATGGLLLVPLVVFGGLFSRWKRFGRDPRPGPVVVAYSPPEGLGPGEVGTLIDNSPDMRDIMAVIVDLAVRGMIRIREQPKAWFSGRTYTFELLRPTSEWTGLSEIDEAVLKGLFGQAGGDRDAQGSVAAVTTQNLEQKFYSHLPGIKTAILDALVSHGFYKTRPDRVRNGYFTAGVVVATFSVALAAAAPTIAAALGFSIATAIVALGCGLLSGLIIAAFGLIMPARTPKGAAALDAIRGFEEFLGRVESHRLASLPLTPELFERYLPYAMALKLDSRWAQAFEGICKEPPRWYVGDGHLTGFHSASFSSDMQTMSACAGAAMQSVPRSSDSSGFSGGGGGGGFSGGGSGGGGGSGF